MKTYTKEGDSMRMLSPTPTHTSPPFGVIIKRRIPIALALVGAMLLTHGDARAMSVDLGSAVGFAILAGSGITITGPTTVTGDIGSYTTATITGTGTLTLNGVNHGGDSVTQSAKEALLAAYNDAGGRAYDLIYAAGADLVGQTLGAGVYRSNSSLALSGTLTFDAQGDSDAIFIIQTGSTFITATSSQMLLINGAQAANIIWQIGSSATLATDSYFVGNILAHDSITLNTGAQVDGQLLALLGAVTLDSNMIAVPECGTVQLLGLGLVTLATLHRRRHALK